MTAVVVGAGLAGLSAARALRAAGIETVVLEAIGRVGGRTRTERSAFSHAQHANLGGSFIDLGQHRIIGLCRELEIPLTPMFSMHPPSEEAGVRKAAMLENHLVLGGELLPREASAAVVAEVEQGLASHSPQTLETMTAWARRAGLSARARQAFNLLAGINPVDRPERTSATLWTGFPIGDHVWMIRDGTDRLSTRLAADADVRTETTVRAIRAAGPRSYAVETDDGDLQASEVILAVPLKGLLEIGFEPELPAWKASAIRALPMSRGGKVACQYGSGAELAAALATGVASDGAVAYASCGSVSAQDTVVVTGLTPDREDGLFDRPEELMSALDDLVAAVAGSRPTRVAGVVQDWGSEPRLHGVVSMTASGERLALQARLAAPLAGLHFAGEYATHVWPSSMDGALRSGERAAREVVIRQTPPA